MVSKLDKNESAVIRVIVDSMIKKLTYPELRTRLLNKTQVAEYIGVSTSTFNRMIDSGDFIEPVKLTKGRLAWDLRRVDEYIDNLSG